MAGYNNLLTHFHNNESDYACRMLFIGFATNVHFEVMLGLTDYLFHSYGEIESFLKFEIIIYGFITLATIANARNMLTVEHLDRFRVSKYLFVCSYFFFIAAFALSRYEICMNIASLGVVILTFATIYGQLTVLGYFKCIPQDLIAWYMLGKSLADIFGIWASEAPHSRYGQKMFIPFFFLYLLID